MEEKVRKIKKEDFGVIMKIFDETDFGCVGNKEMYKPGRQEQMFMIRQAIRQEEMHERILVIEYANEVVGYATIQESPDNWHIGQFAIDSSYRGQGIGRSFMKRIKEMAVKCRRNISLECFERDNMFFLKQGFQKVKEDAYTTEYKWDYQKEIKQEVSSTILEVNGDEDDRDGR